MRFSEIQQRLKCGKDSVNDFGKYRYRTCSAILEAVKPLLGPATLTITDELVMVGERYYIRAVATYRNAEEGEEFSATAYAREPLSKKGMDESQVTGAASTYARKYALCGLLAIDDSSSDPDATNRHEGAQEPRRRQKASDAANGAAPTVIVPQSASQPASADTMNELMLLASQYAEMRGRKAAEVISALDASKRLQAMGASSADGYTEAQAQAAIIVVKGWIEKGEK